MHTSIATRLTPAEYAALKQRAVRSEQYFVSGLVFKLMHDFLCSGKLPPHTPPAPDCIRIGIRAGSPIYRDFRWAAVDLGLSHGQLLTDLIRQYLKEPANDDFSPYYTPRARNLLNKRVAL